MFRSVFYHEWDSIFFSSFFSFSTCLSTFHICKSKFSMRGVCLTQLKLTVPIGAYIYLQWATRGARGQFVIGAGAYPWFNQL